MKNNLSKVQILINVAVVVIICTLGLFKIIVIDGKEVEKQETRNKEHLKNYIEHMYNKDIVGMHTLLHKKIRFFSKNIKSILQNKQNMFFPRHYVMLKEALPSLSYVAIYDKNLNYLYVNKNNSEQNQKNRCVLKRILQEDKRDAIYNIIEETDDGEVLLVYAMKIQEEGKNAKIVEIAVDISYLQEELIQGYFAFNQHFTFDLILWKERVGYKNLLIKSIQIENYKSLLPYNYAKFIPPFIAMMLILILINILYMYMIKEFKREEKKVRDIIDSQSSLMVIFTKNEIISCNKSFITTLGFENEEELLLKHQEVSDFFIPEDEFEISMKKDIFWAKYILDHKDSFYDVFLKDRYGKQVDIFDVSAGLYMVHNDEQYYTASFRNSSIRYQRKQALNLEKQKTQTIIDNSNDGFIDWDTITNTVYASRRLKVILGYDIKEIPDTTEAWLNLVKPKHRSIFLDNVENAFYDEINISKGEILLKHKNKKWVWVFYRIKMFIENDKDKRLILFFTDIDYKKRLEKTMRDKISRSIKEIKEQQQLLSHQSKLASMGEMIGSIAHQWRQPLNELGIKVQNLKFQYKKRLINELFINNFVEQNKQTIMFMSKTIDDFINFYKTDKIKNDFSILEAINFCFSIQSAELKSKNIDIDIGGDDFICNGLNSEFKQVILNLINNSKDAFEENNIENRKIYVIAQNKKILFTDNAGGIPDNIMTRIFEPYFTTKEQGKGTGIGLYMSKSIIENSKGSLFVKNVDDGVCFKIDFSGDNPA